MVNQFQINGSHVYNALVSGAVSVIQSRSELNRINVFPVADGDTGSNLSATMGAVLENMKNSSDLSVVIDSAAEGALMGARGNSGIIFAQFLYGFHIENKERTSLDLKEFIQVMKRSTARLYEVMLNPVEGTIISIIKAWTESMEAHYTEGKNEREFIDLTMKDSLNMLEKTPELLPILKEKGVVDSGAKGFYKFLEGVRDYLVTGKVPKVNETLSHKDLSFEQADVHEEESAFRYCCEAIVTGKKLDVADIKKRMKRHGDSLIIAGGEGKVRLHMHTNDPEEMFADLSLFGTLSNIKADDMHLQMAAVSHPKARVAIVTDSIADLPPGFSEREQVFVMPLQLELDGVVHLDRISLSIKRFYEMNKDLKEHPKSSLPPIKNVENLFYFLADHYESILVLSVSDKLSGTYQMVASVAEMFRKRGVKIAVINTLLNSGAQGLLVTEAVKMAQSGKSLDTITDYVYTLIPRTKILVAVDTMKYLERSGRVSQRAATIGRMIHLKPIMTLDEQGAGKAYGGSLSHEAVIKKIVKQVKKDHEKFGIETFNVVHADSEKQAKHMADLLEKVVKKPVSYIAPISPIVGSTAGEGAVAVSYLMKGRRRNE